MSGNALKSDIQAGPFGTPSCHRHFTLFPINFFVTIGHKFARKQGIRPFAGRLSERIPKFRVPDQGHHIFRQSLRITRIA